MKKLEKVFPKIKKHLKNIGGVFNVADIRNILEKQRGNWNLSQSLSASRFIESLVDHEVLRKVTFSSDDYQPISRYVCGEPSPFSLALSLKSGAYLSHGSAVFLHELNEQIPQTIYVNKEQSAKPSHGGALTQENLNRAFANKQRESRYVFRYKQNRFVVLSGKNTGGLGVIDVKGAAGEPLRVTGVARTLVDIAVRPGYSGGVFQVLEAYRGARSRVLVKEIALILEELDYAYPYGQAIGFYLTRAGYDSQYLTPFRKLGLNFDFYLDYGISEKQRNYDSEWHIFYPKGL